MHQVTVDLGSRSYPVVIGRGALDSIDELIPASVRRDMDARFRALTILDAEFALSLLACADFDEDGRDDYLSYRKPDKELQLVLNSG